MARIRSIKPEFWSDLALAQLSRDARLLYVALWNQADEWARMHGDPRWIKGHCLPYDDDVTLARINELLEELAGATRIRRYVVAGAPYLFLPKLAEHQRLEPDRVPSRLPAPEEDESEIRADSSEPRVDESARPTDSPPIPPLTCEDTPHADPSALHADSSAPIVAKHVAGSREHVAGSREHVAPPAHGADAARTPNQRANSLADAYTHRVPLSNHQAIAKIVRKAIDSGYDDPQIALALGRLIDQERSVTADALRVELTGPARKPSTTGQRVQAGLEIRDQLREAGM